MSSIKLIGTAASRAVRNIWCLNELGQPFEHDPIHYSDKALKAPPYTDLNPNGAIPILVCDGQPLFESMAINLFLVDKFGGSLAGLNAEERGQLAQWTLWAATTIEADIGVWGYHTMFLPEAERKPELAQAAIERLKAPLKRLDDVLANREYLVSNRFTVADLNVAAVCFRTMAMNLDLPHLNTWVKKCWERPAAMAARRARGDKV